jgi:predicted GIY-YIG superfamily endonuclease
MYYVYILKWDRYYIGFTNNIERRFKEHKMWKTITTRHIWDFKLLWYFEFETENEARIYEKKVKRWWHYERLLERKSFIKIV